MAAEPLVQVHHLKKHFPQGRGMVKAVDDVSLNILPGETFGLVGESGCGKSTLGRTILGLYEATAGKVIFAGRELGVLSGGEMSRLRTQMQIIFQDPASSLNPLMTTGVNIQEALAIHRVGSSSTQRAEVERLLDEVGIGRQFQGTFPYELSVGQQQRVAVARALALKPKFIVCDEPVSSLDLSVQGQIINLLLNLQKEYGLAYLFISHDLRVVQFLSHHIAVMYLGHIVESGTTEEVYEHPLHPYTQALLSAVPEITAEGTQRRQRIVLSGEPPSPLNPPSGCPFHPRCERRKENCSKAMPELLRISGEHEVACILYTPESGGAESKE